MAGSRKPKLIRKGTVPCVQCRKPHDLYRVTPVDKWGHFTSSWADPVDGHFYVKMSAEEVVAYLAAPWATPEEAAQHER